MTRKRRYVPSPARRRLISRLAARWYRGEITVEQADAALGER